MSAPEPPIATPPDRLARIGRARRMPIVVVVVAALAGAVGMGSAELASVQGPSPSAAEAVTRPIATARSTAWYCSGLPGGDGGVRRRSVIIANVGDDAAAVDITTLRSSGKPSAAERLRVDAHSVLVRDATADATLVEPYDADVLVEHSINANDDIALGPCATGASANWYFPMGITVRGVTQSLALVNPFASDAVVDVTLVTREGVREPSGLRALEVSRLSQREFIDIGAYARVDEVVATFVRARVGRVIAEQSLRFDDVNGVTGIDVSLGAPATSLEWSFPSGDRATDRARTLMIANPNDVDIDVGVTGAADVPIEPRSLTIGPDEVRVVDVARLTRRATRYTLTLQSQSRAGVVAGDVQRWARSDTSTGITSSLGISRPARSWTFATAGIGRASSAKIALTATGAEVAAVSVSVHSEGAERVLRRFRSVAVTPGRPIDLTLPADVGAGAAVVVTSDIAVYAERVITTDTGVARSGGIPGVR